MVLSTMASISTKQRGLDNLRCLLSWFMIMTCFGTIMAGNGGIIFWAYLPYLGGSPSTWLVLGGCVAAIVATIAIGLSFGSLRGGAPGKLVMDLVFAGTYAFMLANIQAEIMTLVGMAGLVLAISSNVVSWLTNARSANARKNSWQGAMYSAIGSCLGSLVLYLFRFGEPWNESIIAWSLPFIFAVLAVGRFKTKVASTGDRGDGGGAVTSPARAGAEPMASDVGTGPGSMIWTHFIPVGVVLLGISMPKILEFAFLGLFPARLATEYLPASIIGGQVSLFVVYLANIFAASSRGSRAMTSTRLDIILFACGGMLPLILYAIGSSAWPPLLDSAPAMLCVFLIVPFSFYAMTRLSIALHQLLLRRIAAWKIGKIANPRQAVFPLVIEGSIGAVAGVAFLATSIDYQSLEALSFGAVLAILFLAMAGASRLRAPGSEKPRREVSSHAIHWHLARSRKHVVQLAMIVYISIAFQVIVIPERMLHGSPLDAEKHVLAFYYPWYSNATNFTNATTGTNDILDNYEHWSQNGHLPWNFNWSEIDFTPPGSEQEINESACDWNRTWLDISHLPIRGPYDSADPEVLKEHLLTCADVGIDTLIASWNGEYDERDCNALQNLFTMAALLETQGYLNIPNITIYFEHATDWDKRAEEDYNCTFQPPGFFPLDPPPCSQERLIASNLIHYVTAWGNHSKAFKVGGHPVIFVWAPITRGTTIDRWRTIRGLVEREVGPVYLHGNTGLGPGTKYAIMDPLWPQVFNGYHCYILGSRFVNLESEDPAPAIPLGTIYAENVRVSRRTGTNFAATAYPGYDDRNRHLMEGDGGGSYVNRRGTKNYGNNWTYSMVWEDIIHSGARWAVIATFNEWHEGTEIEASYEFGNYFLNLTRHYVSVFKMA